MNVHEAQTSEPIKQYLHPYYLVKNIASACLAVGVVAVTTSQSFSEAVSEIPLPTQLEALKSPELACVAFFVLMAALLAIFVAAIILTWKCTYYLLRPHTFEFHKGVLFKSKTAINYERIQSINQYAGIIDRIVGTCALEIDTASGSANEGVTLGPLDLQRAQKLRKQLFERRQARLISSGEAPIAVGMQTDKSGNGFLSESVEGIASAVDSFGGLFPQSSNQQASDLGQPQVSGYTRAAKVSYVLSDKELILASLGSTSVFSQLLGWFVAIVGLAGFVGQFKELFLWVIGLDAPLVQEIIKNYGVSLVIPGVLVLFVLAFVVSAASAFLRVGGFKVSRYDARIETSSGIIKRHNSGIEISKIQLVQIQQGPVMAALGACSIHVGRIGSFSAAVEENTFSGKNGLMIHPFARVKDLDKLMKDLLPEFDYDANSLHKLEPVDLRRELIRRLTWAGHVLPLVIVSALLWLVYAGLQSELGGYVGSYLQSVEQAMSSFGELLGLSVLASACFGLAVSVSALAVIYLIYDVVNAWLWARKSGESYLDHKAYIRIGGIHRTDYVFMKNKIQAVHMLTNPFQRRLGLATLLVKSAADIEGGTVKLKDVTQDRGRSWINWYLGDVRID